MWQNPVKLSHFFNQADVLAKSIGLIPYDDETKSRRFQKTKEWIFIALVTNLTIVFLEEFMFIVVSIVRKENFKQATMNVSYIGFTFGTLMKVFSVLRKKRLLTALMRDVQQLFPTDPKLQQAFHVRRYVIRFNVISFGFVVLHEILIWWYNLYTVVNYLICEYWLGWKIVPRNLPYNAWLPWQWQDHWSYFLLYISQNVAGHTCMSSMLANDLILCAVAVQIIMHYCHLARQIENYQPTLVYAEDEKFLKMAIQYHQKIISLSSCMNEIFGVSLLINFFSSSFTICFLGFVMTIDVQTDTVAMVLMFLLCSLVQIFMICYFGQELIVKSQNIGHAAFNHNWLATDVRYRKMLLVIVQRAQRPTLLRATTLLPVSMATFTDLVQLSYKFFALLRTMYSN